MEKDSDSLLETDPMLGAVSMTTAPSATDPMAVYAAPDAMTTTGPTINIHRHAHTASSLADNYDLKWSPPLTFPQRLKKCAVDNFLCTAPCLKSRLLKLFPFIQILQNYQWKEWIGLDILSGVSVGVIHIPQGMGFALLTSLPPVFGLYSSFFPVLFYFFFATSRHISMGTMALISLMIGAIVDSEIEVRGLANVLDTNLTANETEALAAEVDSVKVDVAVSVSLLVGIFQILMGLLSLGVVTTFMSMSFVGSFLAGAAVHIITSQLPAALGLKIPRHSGAFKIPLTYYEIFSRITDTNVCSVVFAIICILLLVVLKEIINERFKSKMKMPVPAELIIVILATTVSYLTGWDQKYQLKIVGHIPKGIPAPKVPTMTNFTTYIGDAFLIAVVSFAISISMAKLMAQKHKYKIDMNQELYAYGITHTASAFLNCFAGAQAPPRTMVHDSIGGKTQLSSLVSCVLLLLVLLLLSPLFKYLPIPVLAAIIIVALLPLFKQIMDLPRMGRINRTDLVVWIVTFLSVVILDITLGLFIGIGISIFFVVLHGNLASGDELVNLNGSEVFLPSSRLDTSTSKVAHLPGVKIFRQPAQLFFANVEKFKQQFTEATDFAGIQAEFNKEQTKEMLAASNNNPEIAKDGEKDVSWMQDKLVHTVILDCAAVSYIDLMGVNTLAGLCQEYHKVGVQFFLANCNNAMLQKLRAADAIKDRLVDKAAKMVAFPLIQDALSTAMFDKYDSSKTTEL